MAANTLSFLILCINILSIYGCPNGYVTHDNSCYKLFSSVKATWAEANIYCKIFDSRLAIIETEREQTFLEGWLNREFKSGMSDGVWIDGTDALEEGHWVWIDTQGEINSQEFTKWYPGEPNTAHRTGEDCMDLLHHEKYNWNDNVCEYQQNFLCEKEEQAPQIIG